MLAFSPSVMVHKTKWSPTKFKFCLNTSTISGQNLGLKQNIEITAKAGYDGIELWVSDIREFLNEGNSLQSLKKHLTDSGLKVENAIGFANWLVEEPGEREKGFQNMREDMELMAEIGCKRIAAPPAGVTANKPLDLKKAGEIFQQLIAMGRKTGVMPQLEFWGASGTLYSLAQAMTIAAEANDPDVRILADVYHMFRGQSGFESLKMLQGHVLEIFHLNDYVSTIPRDQQNDKDRVFPGDGVAPLKQILTDLNNSGGLKVLSLELFNQTYWKQNALWVAQTGLEKMKKLLDSISSK